MKTEKYGPEGAPAVELEDPRDAAFHREAPARVEEEALGREGRRAAEALGVPVEVGDDDGRVPLQGPAREALAGAEPRMQEGLGAEADAGG